MDALFIESLDLPTSVGVKRLGAIVLVAFFAIVSASCSTTPSKDGEGGKEPKPQKVDEMAPVTSGGKGQAVLSLHKKIAYADACKFGLTLTNNLPYEITNISFRFSAYRKGDVIHQQVTRNFFEMDPEQQQYREISFSGITCDKISRIEVADPGRCALGDLVRFTSKPGECIRRVHIASTPYVKLVQK